jgi:hypothetical protein
MVLNVWGMATGGMGGAGLEFSGFIFGMFLLQWKL